MRQMADKKSASINVVTVRKTSALAEFPSLTKGVEGGSDRQYEHCTQLSAGEAEAKILHLCLIRFTK
jgi:hypothetical protein